MRPSGIANAGAALWPAMMAPFSLLRPKGTWPRQHAFNAREAIGRHEAEAHPPSELAPRKERNPYFGVDFPTCDPGITMMWDGNTICALIGDLVVGCGGFGESVPEGLRDLADCLDKDKISVTVPGYREPSTDPRHGPRLVK